MLFDSMEIIESRELLTQMRISQWPNMKQAKFQEDHKKLYDAAFPRDIFPRKSIALADFIKQGGKIG